MHTTAAQDGRAPRPGAGVRFGRLAAVLALLMLPIFVANLDCLTLRLDDWCIFNSYASMLRTDGVFGAVRKIVDNEYIQYRVRIQFVSFVIKLFAYLAFGYRYVPHFLLHFAFHLAVAAALFRILARFDERLAIYSAFFFLVMPTGQNVLFWVNTLFQIAPVLFYLLYLHRLLNPLRRRFLDVWTLTAWFTLAQFAGEQTLALLYATPCILLLASLASRASTTRLLRDRMRLGVPLAVGAILLAVYLAAVATNTAAFPGQTRPPGALDPALFTAAVSNCAKTILYSLNPRTWYYARFSIPPSGRTLAAAAAGAAIFLAGLLPLRRAAAPSTVGRARLAALVAVCAAAWIVLIWLPVAYGVMTRMRPMQSRYLYGFGVPLAVLAALPLASLPRRRVLLECAAAFLIFSYLAFLDCYALNELWRSQKEHDRKVWAAVDSQVRRGRTHLLLVNVKQWWCTAIPDFAQPWAIQAYLAAHYPQPITFDLDTLREGRGEEETAVIEVKRPPRRPVSDPLITVYPSYGDYLRSAPGG